MPIIYAPSICFDEIQQLLITHFFEFRSVYRTISLLFCGADVVYVGQKKIRKLLIISFLRIVLGDPLGARTQDPNIKSVVLYQLS